MRYICQQDRLTTSRSSQSRACFAVDAIVKHSFLQRQNMAPYHPANGSSLVAEANVMHLDLLDWHVSTKIVAAS